MVGQRWNVKPLRYFKSAVVIVLAGVKIAIIPVMAQTARPAHVVDQVVAQNSRVQSLMPEGQATRRLTRLPSTVVIPEPETFRPISTVNPAKSSSKGARS